MASGMPSMNNDQVNPILGFSYNDIWNQMELANYSLFNSAWSLLRGYNSSAERERENVDICNWYRFRRNIYKKHAMNCYEEKLCYKMLWRKIIITIKNMKWSAFLHVAPFLVDHTSETVGRLRRRFLFLYQWGNAIEERNEEEMNTRNW